jgi:DNA-directed RNA polymerase specialized sigma24 family protein
VLQTVSSVELPDFERAVTALAAFAALSDLERQTYLSCRLGGRSWAEVAEEEGIGAEAIKQRVMRAQRKLDAFRDRVA